jgi:ketosteroid isomerase-like protein
MPTKLPDLVRAYVEASNSRDAERFGSLFTRDAVVHDEGQDHRGTPAIKKWLASTAEKYGFALTPLRWSEKGNEIFLTAEMTGSFPGSPLSANFHFVLDQGKIAKLNIRA